MQLGEVFERFIQQAPISVMFRTLLEHALDPAEIDRLLARGAERARELAQPILDRTLDIVGMVRG